MGFIKNLFTRHREPSIAAPIPSLTDELVPPANPWKGNLPCVHGPTDGCNKHNPSHQPIHFDSTLFFDNESLKPLTPKPAARQSSSSPRHHPAEQAEISSNLPRDPTSGTLTTLPKIHKSLPYTLSFYHLNSFSLSPSPSSNSDFLKCASTTGSNPNLSWDISPILYNSTIPLRINLAFTLGADLGGWTPDPTAHARSIVKTGLIGSGYRDFNPCPHTHLKFTSHGGEGKNGVRSAGVHFTVTKSEGTEEKREWKSEGEKLNSESKENEEKEVMLLGCEKCFTETRVICEPVEPGFQQDGKLVVSVRVYKDLGEGKSPGDEKWLALTRKGCQVERGSEDFGRLWGAFEGVKE
ncbi:hypothetical protein QBC44DRAFT_399867 [Cladorrhinum sp. PSN332]|nr:hypothetical protein QBC44DRAFT_399867 [Cladorrhinum sp. PSN332]